MTQTLAFIGVGAMGAPMAEQLIDSGVRLRVFDPNPAAVTPLVTRGATAARSEREAAEGAAIVFVCLPSPKVSAKVADAVFGCTGVRIYVEMSTIGRSAIRAIAAAGQARGVTVLDSPVSGGPRGARAGTLATMVSGDRATFNETKPLLDIIARHVFYMGAEPGLAQITKLANNMISGAAMAISFEAMAMAVKAGVDANALIATINASTGRNSATVDKIPQSVLTRSFNYGGKVATMYKDVELCLEEAKELKVPMWVGASVVQLWFQAMTQGRADDDFTTLMKMVESSAGVVVGGNKSGPVTTGDQ